MIFEANSLVNQLAALVTSVSISMPLLVEDNNRTASKIELVDRKGVVSFHVTKGKSYTLCNDAVAYLNKHIDHYKSNPRHLFSIKEGKFRLPSKTQSSKRRLIQVDLQSIARSEHLIRDWERRVSILKERSKFDLEISEYEIDINNSGIREKVLSYSYFDKEYELWSNYHYVLNGKGNINLDFKQGGEFFGDIFYYDGRTFDVSFLLDGAITIWEHSPSYDYIVSRSSQFINGLIQYPDVCKIRPQFKKTKKTTNDLKE